MNFLIKNILCTILVGVLGGSFLKAQNFAVGHTDISTAVGDLGNAQTSTSIYCAPGRLGIKPTVSVNYNSSSGTGEFGLGHSLGGVSAITRSGSNYHLDNEVQEAINFTQTDRFTLDGERLILIQGGYGQANSVYRTENDKFLKIAFDGDDFIVDDKNGGKLFYGNTSNSKWLPVSSSNTLGWYLTRSYDRLGNYIEYEYDNSNGQIKLVEIKYTGFDCSMNGTVSCGITKEQPFNKVVFHYITANYNHQQFIAGQPINNNTIIERIETFCNGDKIRTYDFAYTQVNTHTYLNQIQEKNALNQSMHPISIEWREDGIRQINNGLIRTIYEGLRLTGDFDGDGIKEVLSIDGELNPLAGKFLGSGNRCQILKFNASNFFSTRLTDFLLPYNNISAVMVGDIDADGDDDIVFQTIAAMDFQKEREDPLLCSAYDKYYINSITFSYHLMRSDLVNGRYTYSFHNHHYPDRTVASHARLHVTSAEQMYAYLMVSPMLGDADGDGLPDLIERLMMGSRETASGCFGHITTSYVIPGFTNVIYIYLSTKRKLANVQDRYFSSHAIPQMDFIPMDFNGNGKMDFLNIIHWNNKAEIFEYDQGAFKHIYGTGQHGFPTRYHKHLKTGDFNGDQKTDLLYFIGDKWRIAYSNGQSFMEHDATSLWFLHSFTIDYCRMNFHFEIGDFNGDGRDDILERHNHNHATYNDHGADDVHIYYSKGFGFHKQRIGSNPRDGSGNRFSDEKNIVADFDGDGKSDVLMGRFINNLQSQQFGLDRIPLRNARVNRIRYSNVHSTEYIYEWLTQTSKYHKDYSIPRLSMARIVNLPLPLVTTYKDKTVGFRDETFTYAYKNLLYHTHGRGLMGFKQMAVVHNDAQNINKTTINTYEQNVELTHVLNLKETEIFNNCTNFNNPFATVQLPISKTTYEYSQIGTSPLDATLFTYCSYMIETDFLKGLQKITCFEYDEHGNLIHTASQYAKEGASAPDEYLASIDNKYAQHGSWLPSSLTIGRTTQVRYNGSAPYINQKEYFYSRRGMLLHSESFKNNLQYYVKEVLTYDPYGNVVTKALDSANNTSPNLLRRRSFRYSNGRFLIEERNALGHVSEFLHEPVYGNLVYSKTNDGSETTYEYNAWGDMTKKYFETNKFETINESYITGVPGAYTQLVVTNNLGNYTREVFDAKDRKILEETRGFGGRMHTKQSEYNSRGQLARESNLYDPLQPAATRKWNNVQYDNFGRVVTLNYNNIFDALQITYNKTVTTERYTSGKTKEITIDATGSVEKVKDNGGTITYKYGSHNKEEVITANGAQTTIRYNVQLNKIEMNEPNAGRYLYDYNAFGELLAQRDPLGNEYRFTYDDLGRLTKKASAGYVYNYTYFIAPNAAHNNQIRSEELLVNGAKQHEKTYSYNSNGLIAGVTESINSAAVTKSTTYEYDAYQRLSQVNYPNITINYVYDAWNNLMAINDASNNMIWQKDEVNAEGKLKDFRYGNGYQTTYHYDSENQLSGILSHHASHGYALNMGYNFNVQTNNLESRSFIDQNQMESFVYDNSDRLTNVKRYQTGIVNNLVDEKIYRYSSNGNISEMQNDQLHTLAYHAQKDNAAITHKVPNTVSSLVLTQASTDDHTYAYNKIGRLSEIKQVNSRYNLIYGIDDERIEATLHESGTLHLQKYFINSANMEVQNEVELTYIYAEGLPIAMHRKDPYSNALYYFHVDYQESIMAITRADGTVDERRNYDAWGRPRDPHTWDYQTNPFTFGLTARGYTFHEHLIEFSLINMNARMYDPVTCRVISPDNLVPDPQSSQAYNRYSYCYNNPLKYVDPDGNEPITLLVGIILIKTLKVAAVSAKTAKAIKMIKIATKITSGALNVYNNGGFKHGFFHAAINFGAGYYGSSIGMDNQFVGFLASGAITWANNNYHGLHATGYDHLQSFIGGGMSSFTAKSMSKSIFSEKANATLGMTKLEKLKHYSSKYGKKFASYGAQNWANTFAFDDKDNFLSKPFTTHLGVFAIGGVNGVWQGWSENQDLLGSKGNSLALGVFDDVLLNLPGVYGEAVFTAHAKNKYEYDSKIWYDKKTLKKAGKGSVKRMITSLLMY